MISNAVISADGQFRYYLDRVWDSMLRTLCFVMLNPSTADAEKNDQTIRKCIAFARLLGYGGIAVFNLYAYRTVSPALLARAGYPIGPENDVRFQRWLRQHVVESRRLEPDLPVDVLCAWGANVRKGPSHLRVEAMLKIAREEDCRLVALHLLLDGVPGHPVLLPYSCAENLVELSVG